MSSEHERSRNPGVVQQGVQLLRHHSAGSRIWAGVAPTKTCAVKGADTGDLRDLRLDLIPRKPILSGAGVQNNRRRTLTNTIEVHTIAAHVHHEAGRVIQASVATLFDLLINECDACEKEDEGEQPSSYVPKPAKPASVVAHNSPRFYFADADLIPLTLKAVQRTPFSSHSSVPETVIPSGLPCQVLRHVETSPSGVVTVKFST